MALRRFYNEMKSLKELPELVKPMLSFNYVQREIRRGMHNYQAKYMVLGQYSVAPVFHFAFAGIIFVSLGTLTLVRCTERHQRSLQSYYRYCNGTGIMKDVENQNMNFGCDLSEDSGR